MLSTKNPKVEARKQQLLNARQQQDEDAAQLILGPQFQNEHCLLHAEVRILLEKLKQNTESATTTAPTAASIDRHNISSAAFTKTLSQMEHISKFMNAETVKEARKLLHEHDQLEPFEIAQLANLLPVTPEEAKTLIPSYPFPF